MNRKAHKVKQPRFSAYVAASIDGRISLANRAMPRWTSAEDWKFFQAGLARAEAVVVGPNTFIAAESRLRRRRTFVLSRKERTVRVEGSVTFLNPTPGNLRKVFAPFSRVAVAGGGAIYGLMLEKGMLDELFVSIEPLVLGRGKSMIEGLKKNHSFTLVSVRKLNRSGTLVLHYRKRR